MFNSSKLPKRYPVRASEHTQRVYTTSPQDREQFQAAAKQALKGITGPLVEIGGPSTGGHMSVDKVKLPHGLVLLNIERRDGVNVVGDVRHLPFRPQSIGGVLMKALTRIPEHIAKAPKTKAEASQGHFEPTLLSDTQNAMALMFAGKDGADYSAWSDPSIMEYSLRLAMLKEARRTVEPNGVLLATMLSGIEVNVAKILGFELTANTGGKISSHPLDYHEGEILMTLIDMKTPAGLYIEQQ